MDYSPTWDRHDVRRKVGVITRAEVVGRNVELGGYLFARDFPDIVEEIAKSGGGLYSERAQASRDAFAGGTVNIGAHARAAGSTVKNRDWKYSLLDAVARLRRGGRPACRNQAKLSGAFSPDDTRRGVRRGGGRPGDVVRSNRSGSARHPVAGVDADASDVYGRGNFAQEQSGVPEYVD